MAKRVDFPLPTWPVVTVRLFLDAAKLTSWRRNFSPRLFTLHERPETDKVKSVFPSLFSELPLLTRLSRPKELRLYSSCVKGISFIKRKRSILWRVEGNSSNKGREVDSLFNTIFSRANIKASSIKAVGLEMKWPVKMMAKTERNAPALAAVKQTPSMIDNRALFFIIIHISALVGKRKKVWLWFLSCRWIFTDWD